LTFSTLQIAMLIVRHAPPQYFRLDKIS